MKIGPVVQFLQSQLPAITPYFSDQSEITSITSTNGVATVTTNQDHNLIGNDVITITDAIIAVPVIEIVITSGIGVLKTQADHGMTYGFDYKAKISNPDTPLRMRGSSNGLLNGDFIAVGVPNRFNVQFKTSLPDGAYQPDGAKVLSYAYASLNGRKEVLLVPSPNTFTFTIDSVEDYETITPCVLHTNIRITGAADVERAEQFYTNLESQGYTENKFYLFVTFGNSVVSKDRNSLNDATSIIELGNDPRLKVIEDLDLNVFCPSSEDALCFELRDTLEDVKLALIGTMYGLPQIRQYKANNTYLYSFVSDFDILLNRANMVRGYKFETMYNIGFCDMFKQGNLTPFRNINFDFVHKDTHNSQYINLDVDPSFNQ